jgi:hypothetical protein
MLDFTLTDWKDFAETFEHFAVALGVLIGGGWTLYTFVRLKAVAKAKLEFEEKIRELHESAYLEAKIDAKQINIESEAGYYISAVVTITNVGNVTTAFKFSEMQFIAREVSFDQSGKITYGDTSHSYYPDPLEKNSVGTTVSSKGAFSLHGVFKVKQAGLFLIMFRVIDHGEDDLALHELIDQLPQGGENTCVAHKFLVVKQDQKAGSHADLADRP